jgi:hypothetical protein
MLVLQKKLYIHYIQNKYKVSIDILSHNQKFYQKINNLVEFVCTSNPQFLKKLPKKLIKDIISDLDVNIIPIINVMCSRTLLSQNEGGPYCGKKDKNTLMLYIFGYELIYYYLVSVYKLFMKGNTNSGDTERITPQYMYPILLVIFLQNDLIDSTYFKLYNEELTWLNRLQNLFKVCPKNKIFNDKSICDLQYLTGHTEKGNVTSSTLPKIKYSSEQYEKIRKIILQLLEMFAIQVVNQPFARRKSSKEVAQYILGY